MKTLRLWVKTAPNAMSVKRFQKFPVRIGRGSTCECQLNVPLVSRLHATIDLHEGRLVIRDEGSRFGTRAGKERKPLPASQWVDVASVGGEFAVGPVLVRAELEGEERNSDPPGTDSGEFQTVVRADVQDATVHYASAKVDPEALDASAQRAALRDLLEKRRHAAEALSSMVSQTSVLPAALKREVANDIVEADPEWHLNPVLRKFVEATGLRSAPALADAAALKGVQELLRFYAPQAPPLTSADSVVAFVERLDHVLSTLIEGTAALRYAYLSETQGQPPNVPQKAALAAKLLDWTADPSIIDAFRDDLTEMLAHHRHLVDDAVGLLDRVLASLSPSVIERAGPPGWHPLRHRRLWKDFGRRYDEVLHERGEPLGRTLVAVAEALGFEKRDSTFEASGNAPALLARAATA